MHQHPPCSYRTPWNIIPKPLLTVCPFTTYQQKSFYQPYHSIIPRGRHHNTPNNNASIFSQLIITPSFNSPGHRLHLSSPSSSYFCYAPICPLSLNLSELEAAKLTSSYLLYPIIPLSPFSLIKTSLGIILKHRKT